MGLAGGRGSPIERRDRDGGQATCPGPVAYSPGGQHGQPTDSTRASHVARWYTGGSGAMTTGGRDEEFPEPGHGVLLQGEAGGRELSRSKGDHLLWKRRYATPWFLDLEDSNCRRCDLVGCALALGAWQIHKPPRAWEALFDGPLTGADAGQRPRQVTAVDRWRPLWTAAWGTSGAWPARMNASHPRSKVSRWVWPRACSGSGWDRAAIARLSPPGRHLGGCCGRDDLGADGRHRPQVVRGGAGRPAGHGRPAGRPCRCAQWVRQGGDGDRAEGR
jgi:hypothetical protein